LPEWLSPPVKNRSHTITAKVTVPERGADGVLVTCGGRFGGYALYVQNGKLVYAHNYVGEETYKITSTKNVPSGDAELALVFTSTGTDQGHGQLFINGEPVGDADIPHTVPVLFSVGETFDTGLDTGTAVADYEVPFAYQGTLREVKITIAEPQRTLENASSTRAAPLFER
jgi:arylsulfatase